MAFRSIKKVNCILLDRKELVVVLFFMQRMCFVNWFVRICVRNISTNRSLLTSHDLFLFRLTRINQQTVFINHLDFFRCLENRPKHMHNVSTIAKKLNEKEIINFISQIPRLKYRICQGRLIKNLKITHKSHSPTFSSYFLLISSSIL